MVLSRTDDLDVIGLEEDDLEAAFQVFYVRRGRVMGRRGWVVDKVEEIERPALRVVVPAGAVHGGARRCRKQVLVPAWPVDRDVLEEWLSGLRGSKVRISVPARGRRAAGCSRRVNQNAKEAFLRHKLKRASDFGARSRALAELGDQLGLPVAPLRIEAYDISNLGPTDKVGSMVVFEDGLPKRSDYRRFEIKGVPGQDDFASMEEMLRRRFAYLGGAGQADPPRRRSVRPARRRGRAAAAEAEKRRKRRFAYPPSLIVVDGGRGQLGVAEKVLADRGLDIPVIGLAKRLEEVFMPGQPEPLDIPRGSEALFVLQHIRDEAHRFAITYHRQKRAGRALRSPLDDIPGVGASPEEGAAEAVRVADAPAHGRRGRARGPCRASGRRWRAPSTTHLHGAAPAARKAG